jgi:hypothetical protein
MTDDAAADFGAESALGTQAFDGPGWTRDDALAESGRVRVRHRRPKRVLRRRILLGVGVLALALIASLAWLLYSGLRARTELEAVRTSVDAMRAHISAGDLDAARADADAIRTHASAAHDLTTGPLWASAAAVPLVGDPFATTRAVTSSVHSIAVDALPALINASHSLSPATLRGPDGRFDVSAISAVAAPLHNADAAMNAALSTIDQSSGSTWLGAVNSARDSLLSRLTQLTQSVHSASVAASVLPPLLGAHGPRSYMVTFQNEAELRGTGGLPGAFAILRADNGKLSFKRFESDSELCCVQSGLNLGHEFDVLWSGGPSQLYANSNESPHFPYAAQIWTAMWQRKTGQRLDGAITLDPTTLGYLLAVTGPATLPDGQRVSADNVVSLTQQQVYSRFGVKNVARKQYLLAIARAVANQLLTTSADPTALVQAAGRAVSEYRLLVWARDPSIENQLAPLPISGAVPPQAAPYAGIAIVNTLASKMDYYLHASLRWQSSGCGQFRDVTATMTFHNSAPKGLPPYVTGHIGQPGFPTTLGTDRFTVYYYGSTDAALLRATQSGATVNPYTGYERGHPVYQLGVTLTRGATQTIVLHLSEPAGAGAPVLRMQPMVNPVSTQVVFDTGCSS